MTKPPPYQPKKSILIIPGLFALLLLILLFPSIHRSDVLVCGFPDGSRFILTSDYDWYPTAKLFRSAAEEMNRSWWGIKYKDAKGQRSNPSAAVNYVGIDEKALRGACAKAGGIRNGLTMVGFSYLQSNGEWLSKKDFPWEQMDIPSADKDMRESKFGKAGFFDAPHLFGLILPLRSDRLVLEQPLFRSDRGYLYDKTFDGVYQSFSSDNGKTWSDPVITTDALIFQMGKRWIDQCFVARPIEFNGQTLKPDFPEPCPPNP